MTDIEKGWDELRRRCCADPAGAKRCVMVSRDDFAAAIAAMQPAPQEPVGSAAEITRLTEALRAADEEKKAQREALLAWKWKGWVAIRSDITPLIPTGLIDMRRFPSPIYGTRKAILNEEGLAVRAELERIADE